MIDTADVPNNYTERDMPITQFGELTQCDVDEIAMTLQKITNLEKVWIKFNKGKDSLNKQTEIFKILYGLTLMTVKAKDPRNKKPPQPPIKKLTQRVCKKLPKKKGKRTLDKQTFISNLHKFLYEVHDGIL